MKGLPMGLKTSYVPRLISSRVRRYAVCKNENLLAIRESLLPLNPRIFIANTVPPFNEWWYSIGNKDSRISSKFSFLQYAK